MTSRPVQTQPLSHRLRGFDTRESTVEGMRAALQMNVPHVEFDVRITADGVIVACHDSTFINLQSRPAFVDEVSLEDLRRHPPLKDLASLDDMCRTFADYANSTTLMHVDVKISGYENKILDVIDRYNLLPRIVFVSWIPSVLRELHTLTPTTPLCFSHLSFAKMPAIFPLSHGVGTPTMLRFAARLLEPTHARLSQDVASVRLIFARDGFVPFDPPTGPDAIRCNFGYVVSDQIAGEMRELLKKTSGYVCLPIALASRALIARYRDDGIRVAVFSAKSPRHVRAVVDKLNPDIIYVDVKEVFPSL